MAAPRHVDVLIIGAGLSGIGAADALRLGSPDVSFRLLEARAQLGGTWDLFRYPGVRSDSDMQTLGFRRRPWSGRDVFADGRSILDYLNETVRLGGFHDRISFNRRALRASWSSSDAMWHVTSVDADSGETEQHTCRFLHVCSGYYRYDRGFTPPFDGVSEFQGEVIHPQSWPPDLKTRGRRVVVIGSGATAVTIVPALASAGAHVTMLQRSPSYVVSVPRRDRFADALARLAPARATFLITRWRNIARQSVEYALSRRFPRYAKQVIRRGLEEQLPPTQIDEHFTPRYDPWDQRVCLVPDADLFVAIREGRAAVVTDHVERFTPDGLMLRSGRKLSADVVVTATGLDLLAFGGLEVEVDGEKVDIPSTLTYKGMMLDGVPNFAFTLGYTNLSWTLKADLVTDFIRRLLTRLERSGKDWCVPVKATSDLTASPLLDFQAGYVQRAIESFPQQGAHPPWRLYQTYVQDLIAVRFGRLDDGLLTFGSRQDFDS